MRSESLGDRNYCLSVRQQRDHEGDITTSEFIIAECVDLYRISRDVSFSWLPY